MEQHLLLMILEVVIVSMLVVFLLRRYLDRPPTPPPPSHQPAAVKQKTEQICSEASDFRLEVGQRVEEMKVKPSSASPLSLVHDKPQIEAVSKTGGKKNNKQKKKQQQHHHLHPSGNNKVPPFYHSKSLPNTSSKIRAEHDNWEWHSRAQILAAEFIKENYETNVMRSSI